MKVYTMYFSPTGGTERVARILSGAFGVRAESVELLWQGAALPTLESEDVCVVAVPAYGGRVPFLAAENLSRLEGNGAAAVLAVSFGNRAIDDTMLELRDLLVARGFRVLAGVEAVTEHSLARCYGSGRPGDEDEVELIEFGTRIAAKWKSGDRKEPPIPGNRPYREVKYAPMSPVVSDACIGCRRCARGCPVKAIPEHDVRIVDAERCFSCMHCVKVCPTGARSNAPEACAALRERLAERCATRKENKIYL